MHILPLFATFRARVQEKELLQTEEAAVGKRDGARCLHCPCLEHVRTRTARLASWKQPNSSATASTHRSFPTLSVLATKRLAQLCPCVALLLGTTHTTPNAQDAWRMGSGLLKRTYLHKQISKFARLQVSLKQEVCHGLSISKCYLFSLQPPLTYALRTCNHRIGPASANRRALVVAGQQQKHHL